MTVDIYFEDMIAINFLTNIMIIELSRKVLNIKLKWIKKIVCAFLISLLYSFLVISKFRVYINVYTLFIITLIEVFILYKPKGFEEFLKCILVFKIVAFIIKGVLLTLNSYIKTNLSYLLLIFSFILAYGSYIVLNCFNKVQNYYSLDIFWEDKKVNINALVDSGNYLIEPISKKPVIVAEYKALKELLPESLIKIYESKKESNLLEIVSAISEDKFRYSLRVIPFKSIGKERGMMIGFVVDSVKIRDNVIKKPVIAICRFSLSKGGLYSALISPKHLGGF